MRVRGVAGAVSQVQVCVIVFFFWPGSGSCVYLFLFCFVIISFLFHFLRGSCSCLPSPGMHILFACSFIFFSSYARVCVCVFGFLFPSACVRAGVRVRVYVCVRACMRACSRVCLYGDATFTPSKKQDAWERAKAKKERKAQR